MVSNELILSMTPKRHFPISLKMVMEVLVPIEKEIIFMKYMKVSYLKYSRKLKVQRLTELVLQHMRNLSKQKIFQLRNKKKSSFQ